MTLPLINSLALRQAALVIGSANIAGFTLSAALQTHILTDLVGVGSFVLTTLRLTSLQKAGQLTTLPWWDNRLLLLNSLIGIWGARLASYLFHRITYIKEDKRLEKFYPAPGEGFLDKARSNFPVNLAYFWTIQSLWGFITMLPITLLNSASTSLTTAPAANANEGGLRTLLSISHSANQLFALLPSSLSSSSTIAEKALRLGCRAIVTLPLITLFSGIVIEALADYQKYKYKSDPKNANHWCDVGLWKYSRFPNYFGEMTVWWSTFFATLPAFVLLSTPKNAIVSKSAVLGTIALSALSPMFTTGLLMKLSGVPIHDRNNKKKFGSDPAYQQYVRDTPTIVPRLFPGKFADPKSS